MNTRTHDELANFIWGICNLLRGPYKRNEYRKVILPLTVLRRFDCVLAGTKEAVLAANARYIGNSTNVRRQLLERAAGLSFYNTSKLDFDRLLDDPTQIAQNLNAYIRDFSDNVREIMERFAFGEQVARMDEKNLLFQVIQRFSNLDLSPERVDNVQMGYVFEELIRIGAEQANEEAGEHFTPREVIRLMVSLLLSPEPDLGKSHIVKTIYDPACGTGGMLSVAEDYLREHNREANPILFGQDHNDESWAVCKSDMLIKGENAENIILGDSFSRDGYAGGNGSGRPSTFDYMLANPPFGVKWQQQEKYIKQEHDTLGFKGRFGAGLPWIKDGSLLFLQHMLSKMQPIAEDGTGGSRIAIVFNGSPLFVGDAGWGESNIRRWIFENDWLEAIVALPDQLFYNTDIATYIWVLTNRKELKRQGKVQLIDGRQFFVKMRKSLGKKRNELSPEQIDDLTHIHGNFEDGETRLITDEDPVTHDSRTRSRVVSKVFANEDFGYRKVTIERPLRLNFAVTGERIARIGDQREFQNLAKSNKRPGPARDDEVAEGRARQEAILNLLRSFADQMGGEVVRDREVFVDVLRDAEAAACIKLKASERKAVLAALGERDPEAEVCRDRRGNPEPDTELRDDTETVSLSEDIDTYMEREVLRYIPDAWVDESKTKIGYEVLLNHHFHVYDPPRLLEAIVADLQALEASRAALITRMVPRSLNSWPCLKTSGVEWLGKIPEHWKAKRLKFVASINDDTLSKSEDPLRPIAYVDISSVDSILGIIKLEEMVFEDAPSRARRLVHDGDTIVSTVRTYLRAIAPVSAPPPEMVVSTGFAVIRPYMMDPGFASWVLREHGIVEEIVARSTGVGYPAINASRIGDLPVPLPPSDEQEAIANYLDQETKRIDALIEKQQLLIERLKEYRTALIKAAVTGKIDVRGTATRSAHSTG
ncbi:MAG: N-6 DNA methylase [Caldilineaceae bacterium]|nr:N-6 DNA methylase [Caldilineaceae bacterium]